MGWRLAAAGSVDLREIELARGGPQRQHRRAVDLDGVGHGRLVHRRLTMLGHPARQGPPEATMAASGATGYVPSIHHPEIMRSILAGIVETGDVIGAAGPGRTVLAVTVGNWLSDELAALGSDLEDHEPEEDARL